MRTIRHYFVGMLLSVLGSAVLANPVSLPHDEFMPEDVYGVRRDKPEQMLFQVEHYRLTVGTEQRPGATQVGTGHGVWLLLEGRSLISGSPVRRAEISFVDVGARTRQTRLDSRSQTLHLSYPLSYLDTLLRVLDQASPSYVQARFHGNGTVWADVHGGPVSR